MTRATVSNASLFFSAIVTATFLRLAGVAAADLPGGIAFPGPPPGAARCTRSDDVLSLENDVISASWQIRGSMLEPLGLVNKLNGQRFDQSGGELFRLATRSASPHSDDVLVAVRLNQDAIVAMASRDGAAWTTLATFPRSEFAGQPRLVRLGKMNLKAAAKDNPGDLGSPGESLISEISPAPAAIPAARFDIRAAAHQAATREYPFPQGARIVSCRIDKRSDQGMSWGPALALVWEEEKKFLLVGVRDKTPVFNVTTSSGELITGAALASYPAFDLPSTAFRLSPPPRTVQLAANRRGVRLAERASGAAIEAEFLSDRGIRARWRAELRNQSNYIRQTLELSAVNKNVALTGVELGDVRVPDATVVGNCPGSPVSGGQMFLGVEMPGAQSAISANGARTGFSCDLALTPAQTYTFGAVAGVVPAGQLRRAFLYYLERERARPSQPMLHYNCWYDLGFSVDEKTLLDVVTQFEKELVKKRGVPVQSFLVDDGWDDPGKGLWVENTEKFPGGFRALSEKMAALGGHMGIWISPLGGYGGAEERTAWARRMGLIPPGSGLDLAQPRYRQWFQDRCLRLIREDGVNLFKWDRAGQGVTPHFMALLDVARRLREADPSVFINVTVGTWPSPFWLNHVDTTWRDGSGDVGWTGKGDDREKWLTYRDGNCRLLFVIKAPLYPLNSVMHHGIVHGRCFQGEKVGKSGADLKHDARAFFANGTSLQELYLTPSMVTAEAWDRVAEAAKWARANADVLRDVHWTGGDPLRLQVYGYAAWSPRKGTLMLRNPDDRPQAIDLDAATVFELPPAAARRYRLTSPYGDQRVQSLALEAGRLRTITLQPFEVLVFDAEPEGKEPN